MTGGSEIGVDVCDDAFCAICRPARPPWTWDGMYQTYRWSPHLADYPEFLTVFCDHPGCDVVSKRPEGRQDDNPATRMRRAQNYLNDREGWSCDWKRNLCPEHVG